MENPAKRITGRLESAPAGVDRIPLQVNPGKAEVVRQPFRGGFEAFRGEQGAFRTPRVLEGKAHVLQSLIELILGQILINRPPEELQSFARFTKRRC